MLQLDHLVFATPDLAATTAWFTTEAGVEPTLGGQHVGFGTRNVLVALGKSTYLEIVGPDPEQDTPSGPRPFGIDELDEPRLVTFAVKANELQGHVDRCANLGLEIGTASDMSRAKPDGSLLEWSLTIARWTHRIRPLPFLIDWKGAPSPALSSAQGATLVNLRASHPNPPELEAQLVTLGVELTVNPGTDVALQATLATPNGELGLS